MKILIIDDSDTSRHLIISCLEQSLNQVEIVEVSSVKLARSLYSSDPYFQLILTNLDISGESLLGFMEHLKASDSSVPVITYSQSPIDQALPSSTHLTIDSNDINHFKEELIKALPLSQDHPLRRSDQLVRGQSYQKVRLFYFWRFHKARFPVYLKLGEEKYVKILNVDQEYGPDFISKYEGKHQNYLYILSSDFNEFLELLYNKPLYEENSELSDQEKILRSQHFIQSMAMSSGITPNLIEVASESIENVQAFSKTKKSLSKMMAILSERSGYNSDHATLLCYLTSALCDSLDWSARRSKEKLAMASLFHDISLSEQIVAALSYIDKPTDKDIKLEQLKKFYDHPLKCAELVSEALSQYPQVDTIIATHHERPDGTGFPHGKDYNQIGPLPSLFIVAHDFVSRIYKRNFDLSCAGEVLAQMEEHYGLGHFAKCYKALKVIIKEEAK